MSLHLKIEKCNVLVKTFFQEYDLRHLTIKKVNEPSSDTDRILLQSQLIVHDTNSGVVQQLTPYTF